MARVGLSWSTLSAYAVGWPIAHYFCVPMNLVCPNCGAQYLVDATLPAEGRRVRCTRCASVWRALPSGFQAALLHPSDLDPAPREARADAYDAAHNDTPGTDDAIVARDLGDAEAAPVSNEPPRHQHRRSLLEALAVATTSEEKNATPAVQSTPDQAPIVTRRFHAPRSDLAVPVNYEDLPTRRPRRFVLGALLAVLAVIGGFVLQVYVLTPASVIRTIPASADLYRALGVVISPQGLTIGRLSINNASVGSRQLLAIAAVIENAGQKPAPIPRIIVTVVGADGRHLSSADARVKAQTLAPGERSRLQIELPAPYGAPYRVQVRFSNTPKTR